MTETTAPPDASVNGTQPGKPADEPCPECVTSGERILAGVTVLLGLFIIAVAIDMFTGGKLSGMVPVRGDGGE